MARWCPRDVWAFLGAAGLHGVLAWSAAGNAPLMPSAEATWVAITWEELPETAPGVPGTPSVRPPAPPPAPAPESAPRVDSPRRPAPADGAPSPAPVADTSTDTRNTGDASLASDAAPLGDAGAPTETGAVWDTLPGADEGGFFGARSGRSRSGPSRGGNGSGSLGGGVRASFLEPRDFTRAPRAPDLSALVRRNYPAAARMYRHEGTVELRALILPDGTPSALRVESVDPSGRGFGEACIRTVQHGPRWQPALNRNGFPVAAEASFVCPFRLEQASNSPQERRN